MDIQVFDRSAAMVFDAIDSDPDLAESTKNQYRKAVRGYLRKGYKLDNPEHLKEYAETVSDSVRAFLSAAIGRVCDAENAKIDSLANPNAKNVVELEARMAQAARKLRSIDRAIKPKQQDKGKRAHTWLSEEQVEQVFEACDDDWAGRRNRILLGLLLAAGLRRSEASEIMFSAIKMQPKDDGYRFVLQVRGKGAKDRIIPISDDFARALIEWKEEVGPGRILRSQYGDSLSTTAIYNIVQHYGELIGVPDLAPHDCRRTFLQLGFQNGISLTQLQLLAGHESIDTTMEYLNVELDKNVSASDFVPFR